MSTKVIDVSTWNTVTDWNAVKASGVYGVMIRSGFGRYTSQKDSKFESHYAGAKVAGLKVGTYWYSYAKSIDDAKMEANACLEIIKGKAFDLPVAFDLEDPSQKSLGTPVLSGMVRMFCDTVQSAGYFPMLYANLNWLKNHLDHSIIGSYDIWLAQWSSKPTYDETFTMWQYSSNGSVNGIQGRVDMNECYVDYPVLMIENGWNGFTKPEMSKPSLKSVDEVAQEVIAGKWGNGSDRKARLTDAGYDYSAVQSRVNELIKKPSTPTAPKKSVDEIAKEVINGKWGNGNDRENKLIAAGYDYSVIQSRVNEMLKPASAKPNLKSLDEIAKEVIRGKWGNGSERKARLTKAGYNFSEVQDRVNKMLK